jgi:hypothetical protein
MNSLGNASEEARSRTYSSHARASIPSAITMLERSYTINFSDSSSPASITMQTQNLGTTHT